MEMKNDDTIMMKMMTREEKERETERRRKRREGEEKGEKPAILATPVILRGFVVLELI